MVLNSSESGYARLTKRRENMAENIFEFLSGTKNGGKISDRKLVYWQEFLKHEKFMLPLFDGSTRGKVKVSKATELFAVGTYSISQLRARILSKLYSPDTKGVQEQIEKIQNETLKLMIEMELQKIRESKIH